MADVSQVNLPDGSSYNIKDAVARSTKADRVPLPAEYDPTVTYHEGDICTHEGNIYHTNYLTVTGPWDADKWKILQTPQQDYLHSVNPVGVGSFSFNRKIGTTVGPFSFTEGLENSSSGYAAHAEGWESNSSGYAAHAEGFHTKASATGSHAEGSRTYANGIDAHSEGADNYADGYMSHAEGNYTTASGKMSHTEGYFTKAKYRCQHVFGEYNVVDPSTETNLNNRGTYVEIIGNGTADDTRSNARTLDWDGNEVLAGGLKINGTQNVATQVELTQAEYDALVQAGTVDLVNTVYFITDGNANANSASETTYDNTSSGLSATNVQDAVDELDSGKADASSLSTVATSGSYNDLLNKPLTYGGTLTDLNNSTKTAETFTLYTFNGGATNSPSGTAGGWLLSMVNSNTSNYGSQIASTNAGLYFRKLSGGSFTAWTTLAT